MVGHFRQWNPRDFYGLAPVSPNHCRWLLLLHLLCTLSVQAAQARELPGDCQPWKVAFRQGSGRYTRSVDFSCRNTVYISRRARLAPCRERSPTANRGGRGGVGQRAIPHKPPRVMRTVSPAWAQGFQIFVRHLSTNKRGINCGW